ncbi:YheC/YheD family protein [Alkalicoccus luteus]|uniref:YheC/YheD family protein n=1 Tax=Alkalicoccus luteus TaxID=1237094 RepID=UPI004033FE2F
MLKRLLSRRGVQPSSTIKVGMLRRRSRPSKSARSVAAVSDHYGIEFFYFRPEDVNMKEKTINGFFLEKGKWIRKITQYPEVVDNSLPTKETAELHRELEANCIMTTHRLGTKDDIYQMLEKDGTFQHILIPYRVVSSLKDIDDFLDVHQAVILKPSKGNQGKSIFEVERTEEGYLLCSDRSSEEISRSAMEKRVKTQFKKRNYLVQPFIKSRTKEDHPFDIRIHTRRAENGEWRWITLLPRIGMSNAITSNVNQGGAVSEWDSFFDVQFGERAAEIKEKLIDIAENLPPCIQQYYDFPIDSMGIDIGIEPSGHMWFFEVNTSPGTKFFESEIAEARCQYYEYLVHTSAAVPEEEKVQ